MTCSCESSLKLIREIEIKDKLIDELREALNDPRYCEDHVVFRKCTKKHLQCGDCIVKEFYENLAKEESDKG